MKWANHKDVFDAAIAQGWTWKPTKKGVLLYPPDKSKPPVGTHGIKQNGTQSNNNSDWRGLKRFLADMRNSGFKEDEEAKVDREVVGLANIQEIAKPSTNGQAPPKAKESKPEKPKKRFGRIPGSGDLPEGVIAKELGARVNLLRRKHKMSQEDLGLLIDCHSTSISKIERGKVRPSRKLAQSMAQALDTTTRYLMYGTENHKPREIDDADTPKEAPPPQKVKPVGRVKEKVVTVTRKTCELTGHEVYQALFVLLGHENVKLPPYESLIVDEFDADSMRMVLSWKEEA